jgi:hypothetical protein
MKPIFISNISNLEDIRDSIYKLKRNNNAKSILMLSCDANDFSEEDILKLVDIDIPIFGGIFPQIIYNQQHYDQGLLLVGLFEEPHLTILKNISKENMDFDELLDPDLLDEEYKTGLVIVDGFSGSIDKFIDSLFNNYGIELNYVGGGAGSLDMVQKPCIITPEGLLEDAALLAVFKAKSGVGVRHGWEPLSGPYKVSHSEKNRIYMLENKTAFDIYRKVVEEDSGLSINAENFFEIAKAYPFGITKMGAEKIVRDPIVLHSDGSLQCVGSVPQNTFVHILKGNKESLISAADDALLAAENSFENITGNESVFFIDCISRMLYLEDSFQKEIQTIGKQNKTYFGVLTLGEIANNGKDYLEFYNKTAVVALIQNL